MAAIEALAVMMEEEYCIDMSREYILGFSQGGMMTHTVACQLADRFASAAPFHGMRHLGFECVPEEGITMPLFNVWGTNDTTVPGQSVRSYSMWFLLHFVTKRNADNQFYAICI